jgi:hypothetical protein
MTPVTPIRPSHIIIIITATRLRTRMTRGTSQSLRNIRITMPRAWRWWGLGFTTNEKRRNLYVIDSKSERSFNIRRYRNAGSGVTTNRNSCSGATTTISISGANYIIFFKYILICIDCDPELMLTRVIIVNTMYWLCFIHRTSVQY